MVPSGIYSAWAHPLSASSTQPRNAIVKFFLLPQLLREMPKYTPRRSPCSIIKHLSLIIKLSWHKFCYSSIKTFVIEASFRFFSMGFMINRIHEQLRVIKSLNLGGAFHSWLISPLPSSLLWKTNLILLPAAQGSAVIFLHRTKFPENSGETGCLKKQTKP
jgi:hypothetical protein